MALSADGQPVASGGEDGSMRLWEVSTGRPRATLPAHRSVVRGCALRRWPALPPPPRKGLAAVAGHHPGGLATPATRRGLGGASADEPHRQRGGDGTVAGEASGRGGGPQAIPAGCGVGFSADGRPLPAAAGWDGPVVKKAAGGHWRQRAHTGLAPRRGALRRRPTLPAAVRMAPWLWEASAGGCGRACRTPRCGLGPGAIV